MHICNISTIIIQLQTYQNFQAEPVFKGLQPCFEMVPKWNYCTSKKHITLKEYHTWQSYVPCPRSARELMSCRVLASWMERGSFSWTGNSSLKRETLRCHLLLNHLKSQGYPTICSRNSGFIAKVWLDNSTWGDNYSLDISCNQPCWVHTEWHTAGGKNMNFPEHFFSQQEK